MNKVVKKLLLIFILFIPFVVCAKTYTFSKGVQEGNSYINLPKYLSRNKYLILNGNSRFVMNNNGTMSYDDRFIHGGFLNYREFCISTGNSECKGKSYLVIPTSYWTGSGTSTNKYYINNIKGIDSKSDNYNYGVRVTEFVKPYTEVKGVGTFSNPWYFYGNFYIALSTNSVKYALFNETGTNKIEKYADNNCLKGSGFCTNFDMTITHGYENNKNDGCYLNLVSKEGIQANGNRVHKYEISNITSDIECVAIFVKKEFTITFKCDPGTGNIPTKKILYDNNLVIPNERCTRTGYIHDGWLNGNRDLWTFGSTIKFHFDDDQIGINNKLLNLKAKWTAIKYTVKYHGNNNTSGSMSDVVHTYDEPKNLTTNAYKRAGYDFLGWATSNGGSKVYNDGQEVVNLTSQNNAVIDLYAVWKARNDTPYTVKHYKQNITDDNYTLADTDNLKGTTDTNVTPGRKSYTGFNSPGGQTVSILGDGTRVVNYYYTRKVYYFDLNGLLDGSNSGNISGYGTADVYINGVRKGDDVADYYTQHRYGSSYVVNDIKASANKKYLGNSSYSGTIGDGNVDLRLSFKTAYTMGFHYTGSFLAQQGGGGYGSYNNQAVYLTDPNWNVQFLSSGYLTIYYLTSNVDVHVVGGGGGGGGAGPNFRAGGGGGGYTSTARNIGISSCSVTIGGGGSGGGVDKAGGAGGTSAFGPWVAAGGGGGGKSDLDDSGSTGKGGNGGSGGGGSGIGWNSECAKGGAGGSNGGNGQAAQHWKYNYSNGGRGQGSSTRDFGDGTLRAGGGGGRNGSDDCASSRGPGGDGGGGSGAWYKKSENSPCTDERKARAGSDNYGGGGGGGAGRDSCRYGARGGSGIVIIRNAR